MSFFEVNDELFNWLWKNKEVETQVKINKVRELLGNGNSFTFFQEEFEDSNGEYVTVQLNIGIDDYEDEDNREQIHFHVEIDGSVQEHFNCHIDAYDYYLTTIKELK